LVFLEARGLKQRQAAGGLARPSCGSSAERAAFQRLGPQLRHEAQQFETNWIGACAWIREVDRAGAEGVAAIRQSLRPLYRSLRTAQLEDAELHLIELITDLKAAGLDHAAVSEVVNALNHALSLAAPDAEGTDAMRSLCCFITQVASRAYAETDTNTELSQSGSRVRKPLAAPGLVGDSRQMLQLGKQIQALSEAPGPVLIVGPSGTGKELVAQAIHSSGRRRQRPFIAVNCAALPAELIESELFGHERGAFTGSRERSLGLMRAAADGTLFLDEVTEMPPSTQAKLLRALEQRSVRPVGGVREWPIHARVLGATNRDPVQAIAAGVLRSDLYYRMCVHRIDLSPLSERRGDIPLLIEHFLALIVCGRPVPLGFSAESTSVLMAYSWPGNVRELRNVVEHSCAFAPGAWVEPEHLPEHVFRSSAASGVMLRASTACADREIPRELEPLCDVERRHIRRVLSHTRGNKAQAARVLGLSRHQLYLKLERLGIIDW
jgi:two-component system, NtrC family, response regulator AtoC